MTENSFKNYKFNIIKNRGDPKMATLESGHTVEKEEYVYFRNADGDWVHMKCADYHGVHFIYLDPLFNVDGQEGIGRWFAMCTCGSPAVIISPMAASLEESNPTENLLVCYVYHLTLHTYGNGWHQGQDGKRWL